MVFSNNMTQTNYTTNQLLIDFFGKYDYTQLEFSNMVGIRTGTLRDYLHNKKEIKFSRLEAIIKSFNLTLTIKTN